MNKIEKLKNDIKAVIKTNGNQEITGQLLQDMLIKMIDTAYEKFEEPLFKVVTELPTEDIEQNTVYLVANKDSKNVTDKFIEYTYINNSWEKLGEFKAEVDLSHIEQKLDTKADKEDVDNRLGDLSNYCFKLGPDGRISTPFNDNINSFYKKIQQLNNNEEYTYADINEDLDIDKQQFIYDNTFNKFIKIIEINEEIINTSGDFFRTAEPLDLTHTFYLDNEKTGVVENLSELAIEESNIFVNLPYLDTNNTLDDDTAPQYIYDATDNKWIEVVETYYSSDYYVFNTEEPLDLTHELCYSNDSSFTKWTLVKPHSIALGINASANADYSIALGDRSTVTDYDSVALGADSVVNGANSIALGNSSSAKGNQSTALGYMSSANTDFSIALGYTSTVNGNSSISLGTNTINNDNCIALGFNVLTRASYAVALGNYTISNRQSVAVGYKSHAENNAVALGCNANTSSTNIALGYNASAGIGNNVTYNDCITIGSNSKVIGVGGIVIGHNSIVNCDTGTSFIIGSHSKTDFEENIIIGDYITSKAAHSIIIGSPRILSKLACYSLNVDGGAIMEVDRENYGLYLRGFGGYNGYNLATTIGDTETLNPNIKSVQEVINEKADASAIPTKVSQLINDSKLVNITTAATAEEVVTKFNALLADLKAKGYMEADA